MHSILGTFSKVQAYMLLSLTNTNYAGAIVVRWTLINQYNLWKVKLWVARSPADIRAADVITPEHSWCDIQIACHRVTTLGPTFPQSTDTRQLTYVTRLPSE